MSGCQCSPTIDIMLVKIYRDGFYFSSEILSSMQWKERFVYISFTSDPVRGPVSHKVGHLLGLQETRRHAWEEVRIETIGTKSAPMPSLSIGLEKSYMYCRRKEVVILCCLGCLEGPSCFQICIMTPIQDKCLSRFVLRVPMLPKISRAYCLQWPSTFIWDHLPNTAFQECDSLAV